MSSALLLIDPQNDFCLDSGTLAVKGAVADCKQIADFILRVGKKIESVYVTLDSHPYFHISHPCYWKTKDGQIPTPFTKISYDDYLNGEFKPVYSSLDEHVDYYLQTLHAKGRYDLTLWPPHCLEGSTGHCVEKNIWEALDVWQKEYQHKNVSFIKKSNNAHTEHYSAIQAEVPDPADDTTSINFNFINALKEEDHIYVAGEALSHCVANTIIDLSAYFPLSKITILTDCTSTITGFEKESENFLNDMCARGMKTALSTDINL